MTTTASTRPTKPGAINVRRAEIPLVKIALIDLYNGEANLGIQAIKDIIDSWGGHSDKFEVAFHRYETRVDGSVPDLTYDLYFSSGGPGSPFEGEGSAWEAAYFKWIDAVWRHNESPAVRSGESNPKHVLFICHSFQMMCRYFDLAEVLRRKSESFGVIKVHQTPAGLKDVLFQGLREPFFAADFRKWQVVQPKKANMEAFGASVLALEKKRHHIPFERALMGIRVSKELVGVQFHPEANPAGMLTHFQQEKRRDEIVRKHGEPKFAQVVSRLEDPGYLLHTYLTVIPNFLRDATRNHLKTS